MIEVNNKIKSYLWQLIALGIISFSIGFIGGIWILIVGKVDIPVIYLPLHLIGAGAGYYLFCIKMKGGTVNFYLTTHTLKEFTKDEMTLYDLIVKYRNFSLINLIAVLLTSAELLLEFLGHRSSYYFSFDIFIGIPFLSFITVGLACLGIKYISAWWNIRKNLK